MGQPLYEVEIADETRTRSSELNGKLQQVVEEGSVCRSRETIGRVALVDDDRHVQVMKLYLRLDDEMTAFEARRGNLARERLARDAFLDFLGLPPDQTGEGPHLPPVDLSKDREDSVITCPLMAMEATGARLVRWLIPAGAHVYADQSLYEAEVDGEIHQVPSVATGFVQHGVPDGSFRRIGEPFGGILRHEENAGMCTVAIHLRHSREMHVFRQRSSDARAVHEQFIRESFLKLLGLPPDEEGQGPRRP